MKLARLNTVLLLMIITVNGYVILAPIWPSLMWRFGNHAVQQKHLQALIDQPAQAGKTQGEPVKVVSKKPSIVIPVMGLNQPILEGPVYKQYQTLDRGIWRWPASSTPDKGGNTVLIGHRFTYTNPRGVFYFLNKLRLHDELAVFWDGVEYKYRVSAIRTVPPSNTAIENPAQQPQITLFTCTPLWLPKDRLVVVAKLEEQS